MKQLSYWNKFVKSGNVLDYLYYKQAEKQKGKFYFNRKQKKELEMQVLYWQQKKLEVLF